MTEHTPGPWVIEPFGNYDKDILILAPGVTVDNDDVNHDEAAANARLIAAAPELLQALIDLHAHCIAEDQYMRAAEFVIRKATEPRP